jgi:ferric-dicitrate binding protein FerR (iron transport regulator)
MTNACLLFDTLRGSGEGVLRDHARSCAACALQLSTESAVARAYASEPQPPSELPGFVLPRRRRARRGLIVPAGICLAALEAVVIGARVTWTPAIATACGACAALSLFCGYVLTSD